MIVKLKFSFKKYGYHNRESDTVKPRYITHTQKSAEDLNLPRAPGQSEKYPCLLKQKHTSFLLWWETVENQISASQYVLTVA